MAFCPHCGKQVAEQASKCIACGKEIQGKGGAARFKGTMMIGNVAPAATPEPPAAVPPPEPAAPAPVAAAAPAPAVAAPRPSKVKATMLGTGGAGLAPPMLRGLQATAPLPAAPPPAAGSRAPAPDVQQAPAPAAADFALADTGHQAATPATAAEPKREDSQRFLVGDPMAPAGAAPVGRGGRDADTGQIPTQRRATLLAIGIGGILLIAAVGYFTARFMGLL